MTAVLTVAGIGLYITIAAAMWVQLLHHDAFDEMGAVLVSIVWPAVLPLMVGVSIGNRIWLWRTAPKRVMEALRKP